MKFKIVEEVKKVKPEDFGITNYKFRPDGTLDVFEDVNLLGMLLDKLPFNFGKIEGDFLCSYNNLTSLKGAPNEIYGGFDCGNNNLKDLKYSPKIITSYFCCWYNKLESLNGLNLDGIFGRIYVKFNPDLKLTEKERHWMTLNPGKLIL